MTKVKDRPTLTNEEYLKEFPLAIVELASLNPLERPPKIDEIVHRFWNNGIRKDHVKRALKDCIKQQRDEKRLADQERTAGKDDRIVITVEGDKLKGNIEEMQEVLSEETGTPVFQKDGVLVRLDRPATVEHDAGDEGVKIEPINVEWLKLRLQKSFRFEKPKKDCIDLMDPPTGYCNNLIKIGSWSLPVLKGVVEAPTLLLDGTILSKPGYHEASGLFYDPRNASFLSVPKKPSREQAIESLNFIMNPFRAFPFESDASQSIVPAAILTMFVRRMLSSAPIFAFEAPAQGSGKGLLVTCISLIATGYALRPTPYTTNQEEFRKQLVSSLLPGPAGILFDNVIGSFQSPDLAAVLTSEMWEPRLLGTNKAQRVSTNTTFFATGNNMTIKGDLERRTLKCRIVAPEERPDEREFNFSPDQEIKVNREKFVLAALTILKAYFAAGLPQQELKPFGSFDMWSNLVRNALVWIGCADPCGERAELMSDNPDVEILNDVLRSLKAKYGSEKFTTKKLIGAVEAVEASNTGSGSSVNPQTIALVRALKLIRSELNADVLGKYLRENKDKRRSGLYLKKEGKLHGTQQWCVDGELDEGLED